MSDHDKCIEENKNKHGNGIETLGTELVTADFSWRDFWALSKGEQELDHHVFGGKQLQAEGTYGQACHVWGTERLVQLKCGWREGA